MGLMELMELMGFWASSLSLYSVFIFFFRSKIDDTDVELIDSFDCDSKDSLENSFFI